LWSIPPLINKIDEKILDKHAFREEGCQRKIICSFDEFPQDKTTYCKPDFYQDISLAQVLRGERHFALLLKPSDEKGKFVKIGIAQLPPTLDEFDLQKGGWEIKDVTIV